MAICQNIIGVSLAKLLNIKPLLGLTAGSMSMEGVTVMLQLMVKPYKIWV